VKELEGLELWDAFVKGRLYNLAKPGVAGVSTHGIIMIHVPHPVVLSGFGAPENNLHAPNENIPVECCLQGIKFAATIFQEFADRV